jgi:diphthine-ammonia ligase
MEWRYGIVLGMSQGAISGLRCCLFGHVCSQLLAIYVSSTPHNAPPIQVNSIPHLEVKIKEPYREGYRKAISHLMKTEGIKGIVTGDIYVVDDIHGLWMESVCKGLEIDVIMPLWGQDTRMILNEEVSEGFRAMFTCVKQPWFDEEWPGRELSKSSVKDLLALVDTYGIDPCGEKGEYHTMVIDGPIFKEAIEISKFSKGKKNTRLFIRISEFSIKSKNPLLKRR